MNFLDQATLHMAQHQKDCMRRFIAFARYARLAGCSGGAARYLDRASNCLFCALDCQRLVARKYNND